VPGFDKSKLAGGGNKRAQPVEGGGARGARTSNVEANTLEANSTWVRLGEGREKRKGTYDVTGERAVRAR
jgi:hypothetical protein